MSADKNEWLQARSYLQKALESLEYGIRFLDSDDPDDIKVAGNSYHAVVDALESACDFMGMEVK